MTTIKIWKVPACDGRGGCEGCAFFTDECPEGILCEVGYIWINSEPECYVIEVNDNNEKTKS